jgi:hypothetical protein
MTREAQAAEAEAWRARQARLRAIQLARSAEVLNVAEESVA